LRKIPQNRLHFSKKYAKINAEKTGQGDRNEGLKIGIHLHGM
jgi:hypothetical protein